VRALRVVFLKQRIEITLEFRERRIEPFPKRHAVKLIEERLVKALTNAIGWGALGLRARVIDLFDGQVKLVRMTVRLPTILRASIREDASQRDAMVVEEREDPIVEEIRGDDRRFLDLQLGKANLRGGVDERLLIDPPDALEGPHVEGVLGATVARALTFNWPWASLSRWTRSRAASCASVRTQPSCATFASRALSRCFMVAAKSCRTQTQRTPAGERSDLLGELVRNAVLAPRRLIDGDGDNGVLELARDAICGDWVSGG
jgi:hypothetical protein